MKIKKITNGEYYKSWGIEFAIDFKYYYVNIRLGNVIWRIEHGKKNRNSTKKN